MYILVHFSSQSFAHRKTLEVWNHRLPEAVGECASMHIFNLRVLLTAKLSKFGTTAFLRRLGNVHPCTFFILEFCSPQNSRSLEPPPSMAVGECASMHIFNLRVLLTAKLSKFGTTAVLRRLGNVRPCSHLKRTIPPWCEVHTRLSVRYALVRVQGTHPSDTSGSTGMEINF